MLSTRAPLSAMNEKTLESQMNSVSLDKENTVRSQIYFHLRFHTGNINPTLSVKTVGFRSVTVFPCFQPPSLNGTRVLASKTARKIFSDSTVSEREITGGAGAPGGGSGAPGGPWRLLEAPGGSEAPAGA